MFNQMVEKVQKNKDHDVVNRLNKNIGKKNKKQTKTMSFYKIKIQTNFYQ